MRVIYEANASSSACRLWRLSQVETGAPPTKTSIDSIGADVSGVKGRKLTTSNMWHSWSKDSGKAATQEERGRGGGMRSWAAFTSSSVIGRNNPRSTLVSKSLAVFKSDQERRDAKSGKLRGC